MKNRSLYKNHDGKKHDNNLCKIAVILFGVTYIVFVKRLFYEVFNLIQHVIAVNHGFIDTIDNLRIN